MGTGGRFHDGGTVGGGGDHRGHAGEGGSSGDGGVSGEGGQGGDDGPGGGGGQGGNDEPAAHTLTVEAAGSGTVSGQGIDCGTDCDQTYPNGAVVSLTATPDAGFDFVEWSGDCSGNGDCIVTMNAERTVTAHFAPIAFTLTVVKDGTGFGVVSSGLDIDCGNDCSEGYVAGAEVVLTATTEASSASSASVFKGWSGACSGVGSCKVTLDADLTVIATFELAPNVAFLTSKTYTGNLGGLSGADAKCQALAEQAGLVGTAALQNSTFRAWLSSSSQSAASRLGVATGWVRTDGKPFVNAVGDVAKNRILYPLRLDENASDIGGGEVAWTGSGQDGLYRSDECPSGASGAPWTNDTFTTLGRRGSADDQAGWFSDIGTQSCAAANHLYCFGVDRNAAVSSTPTEGRLAFTSETLFYPGAGLEEADEICALEASANDLPGTYLALLATASASAISRFDLNGPTWVRVGDRLPLAPTASVFANPVTVDNDVTPNVTASGNFIGPYGTWSGSPSLSTPGTTDSTCANWLGSANADTGRVGVASSSHRQRWLSYQAPRACDWGYKVVCLQE